MSPVAPWPEALVGTPAIVVIEQAIARQRLSHSVLLHGDDHDTLAAIALAIADRLLNVTIDPQTGAQTRRGEGSFAPEQHPDCFFLRPAGKMRQISADATRALINKIQVSPAVAPRKVAIIHEVDRMHLTAANVFLKTLEEPPAHTTLLLLTTRPYALLPTIRSRVLHFRFPSLAATMNADGWAPWRDDYRAWLGRLCDAAASDKHVIADHVFTAYGLVARFAAVLEAATTAVWEQQKEKLPADLSDDEQVAIETGIANGLRARLFAEIELSTREFALPRLNAGDETARRAIAAAVEELEHDVSLLRLNLNESAALEKFLLSSLRIWTRR
ncbi:DNA polymerase III subunit gamma/tau [Opitutus sp. ER46]|uniref:DNA polymerase III subunit gamma/tau n=1 Tax=Opitutus sp. ER46 TaxID=2161864 RepID=UPI000D2FACC7|nr:DNA polymerase III subunit gamma/tau [Opitutus sp. ER46]PTX94190.1 DNA polymerase III subunit gamma/tau [Opitutus sp. ER46]